MAPDTFILNPIFSLRSSISVVYNMSENNKVKSLSLQQLTASYAVVRFSWSGLLLLGLAASPGAGCFSWSGKAQGWPLSIERSPLHNTAVTAAFRAVTNDNAAVTAPTLQFSAAVNRFLCSSPLLLERPASPRVSRFSWSRLLLLERESTRVTAVYRAVTAA